MSIWIRFYAFSERRLRSGCYCRSVVTVVLTKAREACRTRDVHPPISQLYAYCVFPLFSNIYKFPLISQIYKFSLLFRSIFFFFGLINAFWFSIFWPMMHLCLMLYTYWKPQHGTSCFSSRARTFHSVRKWTNYGGMADKCGMRIRSQEALVQLSTMADRLQGMAPTGTLQIPLTLTLQLEDALTL